MSQIAGLQDFRQEAPPADTGVFQFSASVLVFQHTFSGTTYVCAVRAGVRGWVLVDYGTDASTVINSALGALTSGRTWKEKVVVKGDFTFSSPLTLSILNAYTILDFSQAVLTLMDNVNDSMISVTSTHDIDIIGGNFYGNYGNQTRVVNAIDAIHFLNTTKSSIKYGWFTDCYDYGVDIQDSSDITLEYLYFYQCGGDDDVSIHGSSRVDVIRCTSELHPHRLGGVEYSGFEIEDGSEDITFMNDKALGDESSIASHYGFHVTTHAGALACTRIKFIGCIANGMGRYGFAIFGLSGIKHSNIELIGCSGYNNYVGHVKGTYSNFVKILGGDFIGLINTWDASITLDNDCDDWLIQSIHEVAVLVGGTGITIDNANCDRTRIYDCDLNSTTKISNLGTGTITNRNKGFVTENIVLSPTFAIDAVALVTVTIPHGLAITPAIEDCSLTVLEVTDVDDWGYNLVKVDNVGAVNVVAKVNVSVASATGGATAKLSLRVGKA